jgi:hypothetical protein
VALLFFETKRKSIAPHGLNFIVGFAMQIIVQRLKHSNRWRGEMQRKMAKTPLKAGTFLDWLNLKKNYL